MLKIIISLFFVIVSLGSTSKLQNGSISHVHVQNNNRNPKINQHENASTRKLQIIGGSYTSIEKHPYEVSVFVEQNSSSYIAGTVLNKNWILTVANYVLSSKNQTISVRVGSNYSNYGGTVYTVKKYVIHPKHVLNTLPYDLALLKLSKPLTFGKTVKAVGLTNKQLKQHQKVVVSGWSTMIENVIISGWFMEFTLSVENYKTCVKKYATLGYINYKVFRTNICASSWGDDGPMDEFGAPLVANNKLYGVYSWRSIESDILLPSVFTNVHPFRRWIKKTIRS